MGILIKAGDPCANEMKTIAIITGAAGGIGRELIKSMPNRQRYQEIWVLGRNEQTLQALQEETTCTIRPVICDLSDPDFIETISNLLEAEQPIVKLLINAAGYGIFRSASETSMEDNLGMIDVNCRALVAMTQLALPYMSSGSVIIQIASVAGFQPIPYINIYGASKAFVLSFGRALNVELRSRKIRVLTICPFWTKSAFFDRAIDQKKPPVIKKYIAMYEPSYIAECIWKAYKRPWQELCIPGWKSKLQVLGVKLLPHRLIMEIWLKQQKL